MDEPSETEYARDGEVRHYSEDNTGSPDKANGTQKKRQVAKAKKLTKKTAKGKNTASQSQKKKLAKHVLSEQEIVQLARKVKEAGVGELNNVDVASNKTFQSCSASLFRKKQDETL